jgi:virulence factor Mce-like protein
MIKTVPTFGRLATMVLFALSSFGALLYLWMAFGGGVPFKPQGYRFDVLLQEATQLGAQADVRIAGVNVGKVVRIEPGEQNRMRATIELDERYAPLPRDSRAILRLKSLLGETFVELTPGNRSAGALPEGGTLPVAAVHPTVELDEVLSTFDPPTRRSFQDWMQASAEAMQGRGAEVNAAFGQLPAFVEDTTRLFETLDAQRSALRKMVKTTGDVFDAISARDGDLAGLITETERLFATTAARNRELARLFEELPRLERESTITLPRLTAFARTAEPVVRQLQPAASEMEPVFDAVDRVSPELERFFVRLGPVVEASERGIPALEQILDDLPPLLDRFHPFLRNVNPMLAYIGRHRREVTSFLGNAVAASLARHLPDTMPGSTKPVHYLRAAQVLSPEGMSLQPRPFGSSRQNAYLRPGGLDELTRGLPTLSERPCTNGTPAPPTGGFPETLPERLKAHAWRTDGRDVARPPCRAQGTYPGFSTIFPQLRAEE